MFELKPIADVMETQLVELPLLPVDMAFRPPSAPGIGVEIREDISPATGRTHNP